MFSFPEQRKPRYKLDKKIPNKPFFFFFFTRRPNNWALLWDYASSKMSMRINPRLRRISDLPTTVCRLPPPPAFRSPFSCGFRARLGRHAASSWPGFVLASCGRRICSLVWCQPTRGRIRHLEYAGGTQGGGGSQIGWTEHMEMTCNAAAACTRISVAAAHLFMSVSGELPGRSRWGSSTMEGRDGWIER